MFEPIQGCGGMETPDTEWLCEIVDGIHKAGGLVVADECQTGFDMINMINEDVNLMSLLLVVGWVDALNRFGRLVFTEKR